MKTISQAEKTDVLLALALAFEKKHARGEEAGFSSAREIVERRFAALRAEDYEALKSRAETLDDLPEENLAAWSESRLEKIRGRGLPRRLDENINPSHIVEVLSREPHGVRVLILRNLPPHLSRRIALYMDLNFLPDSAASAAPINAEIVALVRQRFLSNFVAREDIFEPDELDGFSVDEMENFIRHLGLREVAIACRGINSKETLAAFLNRFDGEDVREIALYITELDKIRPFWVAQADELVRKSWSADLLPARVIKKIGTKLLAVAYAARDETKSNYAAQKLPIRDVKNWQRLVSIARKKFDAADDEGKLRLDKRRRIVERLAAKFSQAGRL